MKKSEKENILKWIRVWQKAGDILEKERRLEIENANTKEFLEPLKEWLML